MTYRSSSAATDHAEREAAHRQLAAEVTAPAFTALALGMAAWVEQDAVPGDAALNQLMVDLAPRLLDRMARKVRRRGRRLGHHSDAERHALRKSLKKLRYGVDYLRSLYPDEAVDGYLQRCKKLQKLLVETNDAVTAPGLADRLCGGSRPCEDQDHAVDGEGSGARSVASPSWPGVSRPSTPHRRSADGRDCRPAMTLRERALLRRTPYPDSYGSWRDAALGRLSRRWKRFRDQAPFWA
jgi:hypothetical protein